MKGNWVILALLALLAWLILGNRQDSEGGGGGGGGYEGGTGALERPFSVALTPQPPSAGLGGLQGSGVYLHDYAGPGRILSYASTSPGARPSIQVFTATSAPNTYVAPTNVMNMPAPGSALPAPSPGTGLGPRAIML